MTNCYVKNEERRKKNLYMGLPMILIYLMKSINKIQKMEITKLIANADNVAW